MVRPSRKETLFEDVSIRELNENLDLTLILSNCDEFEMLVQA